MTGTTHTPLEILDATLAVIAVRGYYQPTSRQWEEMVPTAWDVAAYLNGYSYTGEPRVQRAIDMAVYPLDEPARILAWARAGADTADDYRSRLARVAALPRLTERDLPLMCSAVQVWRHQQRRAADAAQRAADATISAHQGAPGARITRTVTVAAVVNQGEQRYGYTTVTRYLIKLRDTAGHVYIWPTTSRTRQLPAHSARIQLTGTIKKHATHQGTAQTFLTNCRWKLAS
ncbi:hypothetical protein [Streptomyces celluloflavus]|uniref:hypothetical protein n=1 Tax=Streptomyces celluloflavus TaxID=58344 RepID=UPI00369291B9